MKKSYWKMVHLPLRPLLRFRTNTRGTFVGLDDEKYGQRAESIISWGKKIPFTTIAPSLFFPSILIVLYSVAPPPTTATNTCGNKRNSERVFRVLRVKNPWSQVFRQHPSPDSSRQIADLQAAVSLGTFLACSSHASDGKGPPRGSSTTGRDGGQVQRFYTSLRKHIFPLLCFDCWESARSAEMDWDSNQIGHFNCSQLVGVFLFLFFFEV